MRVAYNQGYVNNGTVISSLGRGNYVATSMLGNLNLKWEKARQQNYGLDINFLNGFSFNFDYFREMRDDILVARSTVPQVQGLPSSVLPRVNMGKVENHGYEMVLGWQKALGKDWFITVSGNYNFARKVLEADEVRLQTGRGGYLYPYRQTGFPIGQTWVLQVDYEDGAGNGYINTDEDMAKYDAMYKQGGFVSWLLFS